MSRPRLLRRGVPAALAAGALLVAGPLAAARIAVSPGGLTAALASAGAGDTVHLRPGTYAGPIVIERSLTLSGDPGSVIDGGGAGRVVVVAAPDVTVRGLTIVNSGARLATEDAGIYVTGAGARAHIDANTLRGNLIGVYLKGPAAARVTGNRIEGRSDLRMNERGNGVQLWNTPGSVVEDNDIRFGRDGIFVTTSRDNVFRANRLSDLRFAVHYMYTNASEVSDNVSLRNHIAYALMYSHQLRVHGNVSLDDRDRGILLNYANQSDILDNRVGGGPEKCVFIYNANLNVFRGNVFEGCDIGIHFTAGSEGNEIADNAFLGSRTQVKYVGTRHVEWSAGGRGNYWSDNVAFDLDGDGVGDVPYRPNDLVDQLLWRYPLAKLLVSSPALQVLRWAQAEFPALHPGGVTDSAPLMRPPPAARRSGG